MPAGRRSRPLGADGERATCPSAVNSESARRTHLRVGLYSLEVPIRDRARTLWLILSRPQPSARRQDQFAADMPRLAVAGGGGRVGQGGGRGGAAAASVGGWTRAMDTVIVPAATSAATSARMPRMSPGWP